MEKRGGMNDDFRDKTGVDLSLHGDASSFEEGLAEQEETARISIDRSSHETVSTDRLMARRWLLEKRGGGKTTRQERTRGWIITVFKVEPTKYVISARYWNKETGRR